MPIRAKGLVELREAIATLPKIPSQISKDFAAYAKRSLAQSFGKQTDPFGTPWAPYTLGSILRGRVPPLLKESGALAASRFSKALSGAGIEVGYTDSKGKLHQAGTSRMVARPIVPDTMPPAWRERIEILWRDALRRRFRGQ